MEWVVCLIGKEWRVDRAIVNSLEQQLPAPSESAATLHPSLAQPSPSLVKQILRALFLAAVVLLAFLESEKHASPPAAVNLRPALALAYDSSSGSFADGDFNFSVMPPCILEDLRRRRLVDRSWLRASTPNANADFAALPTYVVSYAGGAERQELMQMHLDAIGLSAAITTFEFDVSEINVQRALACWMHPGLLGVVAPRVLSLAMKHISIAYDVVNRGLLHALVLEDDVEFRPTFPESVVGFLADAPPRWDAIFMSECYPGMLGAEWAGGGIFEAPRLWRMKTGRCTDAFLLSQSGARMLLTSMPLKAFAIDWQFNVISGAALYWADPPECRQDRAAPSALNAAGLNISNRL